MMREKGILVIACQISTNSMSSGFRTIHLLHALHRHGQRPVEIDLDAPSFGPQERPWRRLAFKSPGTTFGNWFRRITRVMNPHYLFLKKEKQVKQWIHENGVVPAAIYCGTPPHELQILACKLAGFYGVPLIADLRDEWSGNHRKRFLTEFHKLYAIKWEATVVESAAKVILNNCVAHSNFSRRYPISSRKFMTITNGYDMEFDEIPLHKGHRHFKIVYAGSSYNGFLESWMSEFHDAIRNLKPDLDFEIVTMGGGWALSTKETVASNWTHRGLLCARDMVKEISEASVVLLLMPPGEMEPSPTIPLKTFNYLKSYKTIVYIGECGATTQLLGKFEGTFSLPRSQPAAVAEWFVGRLDMLKQEWTRDGVDCFAIDRLMDQLAMEIKDLMGKSDTAKISKTNHN